LIPTLRFAVVMLFSLLLSSDVLHLYPIQLLNQKEVLQLHIRYFNPGDVEVGLYLTHLYRLRACLAP